MHRALFFSSGACLCSPFETIGGGAEAEERTLPSRICSRAGFPENYIECITKLERLKYTWWEGFHLFLSRDLRESVSQKGSWFGDGRFALWSMGWAHFYATVEIRVPC